MEEFAVKTYVLKLAAALLFYASGIAFISSGNSGMGCAMVALGSVFFVQAITAGKKD